MNKNFDAIMGLILPGGENEITSPYYRRGAPGFPSGKRHGGIDFNFKEDILDSYNISQVFSPVTGTLVANNLLNFGTVAIRQDSDLTVHRILHLTTINSEIAGVGSRGMIIYAGDYIGNMGGRGEYTKRDITPNDNIDNPVSLFAKAAGRGVVPGR